MIDSHAHLFLKEFDRDREDVITRARAQGIEAIVNVGIDVPTSRTALELARQGEDLLATAGLHPCSPIPDLEASLEEIRRLARSGPGKVVAIGEIGLDFYWKDVEPSVQEEKLLRQLELAIELDLPVVIHCRDALPEIFRLLEDLPGLPRGVFHCFPGCAEEAIRAQALGFHISFAGNVTYPKAETLREAARAVAPERILLETDSPYLPPQGMRGRRNEPAFGVLTRDRLAEVYGMKANQLDRIATENTRRLFRL